MAISGHKDIRMLQRYSHTNEDAKEKAIRKIGNRLEPLDSNEFNKQSISKNIQQL
jgi:hypothetical protein